MATSGTTNFNLDIFDIVEEAYELSGSELRSGYQMRTARRSLDLMMREWGNKGINFWTIRETVIPVPAGTHSVTLDKDVIDILDATWRTGSGTEQNDRIMGRMSVVDWSQMGAKNAIGIPTQYWVNRIYPPVVWFWQVPSEDGFFQFFGLRSIQDNGGGTFLMDIPPRFLPALTTGLAYYLALKNPAMTQQAVVLKVEYDRQFQLASEEDRERAVFRLVPDLTGY